MPLVFWVFLLLLLAAPHGLRDRSEEKLLFPPEYNTNVWSVVQVPELFADKRRDTLTAGYYL